MSFSSDGLLSPRTISMRGFASSSCLQADDRAETAEKRGRRTLEVIDDPLLLAHLIDVLESPAAPNALTQ